MTILTNKDIKNLPVVGKSGKIIGKVAGFEFDADSLQVLNIIVRSRPGVAGMFQTNLVINRDRVIEINKKMLLIDDTQTLAASERPAALLPAS